MGAPGMASNAVTGAVWWWVGGRNPFHTRQGEMFARAKGVAGDCEPEGNARRWPDEQEAVAQGRYSLLAASLQPATKGCYYTLFNGACEQRRSESGGISRSYPQRIFHRPQTRSL